MLFILEKLEESNQSLYKLLIDYEICIPIIQRDYIQGSDDEKIKFIRGRLIKDIIRTLKSSEKRLNLNIIYGVAEVEEENKGIMDSKNSTKILYPVDGQQRLTTLYLFHWFLAVRSGEINNFLRNTCGFTYTTRNSAREFFSFLMDTESSYSNEFNSIIISSKEKKYFIENVKNKIWFKSQWNNDMTILAILNVLGDFIDEKIDEKDAEMYYERLIDKNNPAIYFDIFLERKKIAENYSATRYIRMNSRGKQLEDFENVKAILEVIEDKLEDDDEKLFVRQYDTKFIDVFYKRQVPIISLEDKTTIIEEKTKKINEESINLLMSIYNILIYMNNDAESQKEQYNDYYDYYNKIYEVSQKSEKELLEEKIFWKEYFQVLNAILKASYSNENIVNYIEEIFKKIKIVDAESSNIEDKSKIIAYVRYIYHIYMNFENEKKGKTVVLKKHGKSRYISNSDILSKISRFEYILKNLRYDEWKQNRYEEIEGLVKEIALKNDCFEYFAETRYEDILDLLKINSQNKLDIKDIKVRIKEQCIKSKIIKRTNAGYKYFFDLEERSIYGKIQYILYISEMWNDEIRNDKIKKLKKYMKISKIYFQNDSKDLELRKIFAIATIWDYKLKNILSSEEINKIAENKIDNKNKWYWDDNYYFWNDSIRNETNQKLFILKRAYDLIIDWSLMKKEKLIEFVRKHFDSNYDACWLKYALDRDYNELLKNVIEYIDNNLLISIEDIVYGRKGYMSFFPVVYYLDEKSKYQFRNEEFRDTFKSIKDTYTHISLLKFMFNLYDVNKITLEKGIIYEHSCNKKYSHYNKYNNSNINLYYKYRIEFPYIINSVVCYNGEKVKIYCFESNIYKILEYDYINSNIRKYIQANIKDYNDDIKRIDNEFYINKNYDEILEIYSDKNSEWTIHYSKYTFWQYRKQQSSFNIEEKYFKTVANGLKMEFIGLIK
ncbi:hypothetical protein B0H39_004176 [Clostridium beijerinckii]|uniref:GmrSD restriction endonuclease domain-containing protein n=1 Tax=Clostridium beijerinckii TaxID=1520 RepID=UPI001494D7BA|nr:hypothetical protein [Clostridium beijerinckii]